MCTIRYLAFGQCGHDHHSGSNSAGRVFLTGRPAWTPLFLAAAGVIVEYGAVMSHAAIVARELGIPAVVGVDQATTLLATGTHVTIDGSSGTVTINH